MTPLEHKQTLRNKREDAATYRRWADECPVHAWAEEYKKIAMGIEAEIAVLENMDGERV